MNNKKENSIDISPLDIDHIIDKWNETKKQAKRLHELEEKYRLVIDKIMDKYETDKIQGTNLKISRYEIRRRFLTKENVPPEIYDKYAVQKTISCFRISGSKVKSRSKKD
jgi:hypothetical protein